MGIDNGTSPCVGISDEIQINKSIEQKFDTPVTEVLGDRRNGPACGWLMCIELNKEVSLLHQFWGWQRARGPKGRNLTQELNMCDAMKEKESEDSYSLRGNEK